MKKKRLKKTIGAAPVKLCITADFEKIGSVNSVSCVTLWEGRMMEGMGVQHAVVKGREERA